VSVPSWADLRKFCEIDGWEPKRSVSGAVGNHFRYRKQLPDGTWSQTRASHGSGEIGDPALWHRIWREQLKLEREEQFWEALRTRRPVARRDVAPQPVTEDEGLPGWLVDKLSREVRLSSEEIAGMTEEQALGRLHAHYSRPR